MRLTAVLFVVLTVACGDLRGAVEYSDAYLAPGDTGKPDTARPDSAGTINALQGDYQGDPLDETRAAFRFDSAKTPAQPWIVFISTSDKASLGCDLFKTDGWKQRIPDGAVVHEFHLGDTAAGTYTINDAEPLGPGRVHVERTTKTSAPVAGERARSGTITLNRWDATGASGNFLVTFEAWIEDDPATDAGPTPEPVQGVFDVARCAVDW